MSTILRVCVMMPLKVYEMPVKFEKGVLMWAICAVSMGDCPQCSR